VWDGVWYGVVCGEVGLGCRVGGKWGGRLRVGLGCRCVQKWVGMGLRVVQGGAGVQGV
jgi:hypothetical protein